MTTVDATVLGRASARVREFAREFKALTAAAGLFRQLGDLERRLPALQRDAQNVFAALRAEVEALSRQIQALTAQRGALQAEVKAVRAELDAARAE